MSRIRVGVGLVAVAAGTAWASGGIHSVAAIALRLAELLPILLVLGGVSAILLLVVPRGALAGPAVLILVGLLGFAVERGLLPKSFIHDLPAYIVMGTGVVIAMSRRQANSIEPAVLRHTAIFFSRQRCVSGIAPGKIIVRALFTLSSLDLSQAKFPTAASRIWVDVTCLIGRVEIILPKGWEIQAGRIELARQITFSGTLTSGNIASMDEDKDPDEPLVVINVLGWGGVVAVERSSV